MSRKQGNYMNKRVKENFFKQSKELKVRARSYFKLEQLDNKFNLFEDVTDVLDLGCAPGGWTEYINKTYPHIKIVGVDLLPIRHVHEFNENVEFIEDDFNDLEHYVKDRKFDLIISDMAPEFSGVSKIDRGRVHDMNHTTLQMCKKYLREGGNLAIKSFGGSDLAGVRKVAQKLFKRIKEYKPHSSDQSSPEFFLVCFKRLSDKEMFEEEN